MKCTMCDNNAFENKMICKECIDTLNTEQRVFQELRASEVKNNAKVKADFLYYFHKGKYQEEFEQILKYTDDYTCNANQNPELKLLMDLVLAYYHHHKHTTSKWSKFGIKSVDADGKRINRNILNLKLEKILDRKLKEWRGDII